MATKEQEYPTPLCGIHSQTLKGIEETCQRLEAGQARIEKWLLGNGTPGLIVELDRVKEKIKTHDDSINEAAKSRAKWMEWVLPTIIGVIVIGLMAALWEGLKLRLK